MTSTTENPVECASRIHPTWAPYSLEVGAELEKLDCEVGHDYVPMDVFVDPRAIKQHFQVASIRARWTGMHPTASSHER